MFRICCEICHILLTNGLFVLYNRVTKGRSLRAEKYEKEIKSLIFYFTHRYVRECTEDMTLITDDNEPDIRERTSQLNMKIKIV